MTNAIENEKNVNPVVDSKMTKRELINALEALLCNDDTRIAVYAEHQDLYNCFVEKIYVEDYDGINIINLVI